MAVSTTKASPSLPPGRAVLGKGAAQGRESDLGAFNLRDTLSGIVVREANFGEFLAALKSFGPRATNR